MLKSVIFSLIKICEKLRKFLKVSDEFVNTCRQLVNDELSRTFNEL